MGHPEDFAEKQSVKKYILRNLNTNKLSHISANCFQLVNLDCLEKERHCLGIVAVPSLRKPAERHMGFFHSTSNLC